MQPRLALAPRPDWPSTRFLPGTSHAFRPTPPSQPPHEAEAGLCGGLGPTQGQEEAEPLVRADISLSRGLAALASEGRAGTPAGTPSPGLHPPFLTPTRHTSCFIVSAAPQLIFLRP